MKATLVLNGHTDAGGSALVMHNERLADPLDPLVREISAITKKRNKTEADHMEIARLEFLGGLYTNGNGPMLPAWNILRCLQDGAKRHKRGPDILRGVYPLVDHADIAFNGDEIRDPDDLWKAKAFALRKTVGIQRSRTMRTRPIFTEWSAKLDVEIDPVILDLDTVAVFWADAGKYIGIGEMRPIYGRFKGSIEESK